MDNVSVRAQQQVQQVGRIADLRRALDWRGHERRFNRGAVLLGKRIFQRHDSGLPTHGADHLRLPDDGRGNAPSQAGSRGGEQHDMQAIERDFAISFHAQTGSRLLQVREALARSPARASMSFTGREQRRSR